MSLLDDAKRNRGDTNLAASLPGLPKRQKTTHAGDDEGRQLSQRWVPRRLPRRLSRTDYTVGWICALPIEMAAAKAMLDHLHESLPTNADDTNTYTMGSIGVHNIVMACLPARQYGTNNAATVASNMRRSFPSIRLGLMVGIGGGVPGRVDMRLGDVVVSEQVVPYDFGKTVQDGHFQRTGTLNKPPPALMTAVAKLQADHASEPSRIPAILSEMLGRHQSMVKYTHPGALQDRLFDGTYDHVPSMESCERCDATKLLNRPARDSTDPYIHYGVIASGNQVMKHGKTRDQLARELNVLCFEMEAAGLMDNFPCLVVRGICDYSDSHKNKQWQEYAAATAAAYTKELLAVVPSNGAHETPEIEAVTSVADRREVLLASLSFDQIDVRRSTVRAHYSNTCQWLMTHADYLDWVDPTKVVEHHGFLWIRGKPGAGKSTIMNFAHNQAIKDKSNKVISFFFNARGSDLERSTVGMYRSLLFQLLKALPGHLEVFDEPRHKGGLDALYATIIRQNGNPEWDLSILQGLLRSAIEKLDRERVTCFIDALDECEEDEVEEMVEYFEDLGARAVSNRTGLRICFSSRHYPHIDIRYGRKLTLELQEGHREDVATYIQKKLKVGKSKAADEIRNKMQVRSGGIFMWVVLVVDILNEEFKRGRIFEVRKRLDAIPTELRDLFKEILSRDQKNLRDMQLCIQWILFAKRPLRLEEYYFAVVSGLCPDELGEWDPEYVTRDDMSRFLLSSSKGLAETTRAKSPTVQFIHESVREFFLKDGLRELWPDLTGDFQSCSHDQLRRCCHVYSQVDISAYVPPDTPLPKASSDAAKTLRCSVSDKFPFLEYATHHVLYHADAAAGDLPQDEFLKSFLLKPWINLSNLFGKFESRRHTSAVSLLYILAENNFARLIRPALDLDPRISIKGGRYQYPLFAALVNGHREALNYGKDFVVPKDQTPLEWAMNTGNTSLVMHLIASREFSFIKTEENIRHLMWWAAKNGHEEALKLLIQIKDIGSINLKDLFGQTPLSVAAMNGQERAVKILLEAEGINVNSRDDYGKTPLYYAVRNGQEGTVKILLEAEGINVNSRDDFGKTPLYYAAVTGYERVLKLLLDTEGVDANATDGRGRTSIFQAAENEHKGTVKLLLETKGFNPNLGDTSGRTPLLWAVGNRLDWLVKLLLDTEGIEVNAQDLSRNTPLSLAVMSYQQATMRLLLANNADTEARDWAGRTPLFLAIMNGDEAVRRLLSKKGPGFVVRDKYGRTPLSDAVRSGPQALIDLLREEDARTKTEDATDQKTPPRTSILAPPRNSLSDYQMQLRLLEQQNEMRLMAERSDAAEKLCAMQLLLEEGAHIDAEDKFSETPISWAERGGHHAVVQLLKGWHGYE
ncbi:hypothetical protein ACJZ2D_004605 [Fusarium nematophilum]